MNCRQSRRRWNTGRRRRFCAGRRTPTGRNWRWRRRSGPRAARSSPCCPRSPRMPTCLILNTGYQFPETLETRQRLMDKYGLPIHLVGAEQSVAAMEAEHGGPLYDKNPDLCCHIRKVVPLAGAIQGYEAWISAIRRDQTPERAAPAHRRLGQKVPPGEDQPAGELDQEGRLGLHPEERRAVQPAARPGLPQRRLLALYARRRRGPGRPGGALGGHGQEGMRPARLEHRARK